MTPRDLLSEAAGRLARAGVPTPEVDAELLLRHVTGRSSSALLLADAEPAVDEATAQRFAIAIARREAREPLQLIVGSVGFRYVDIEVRPGVFIPRPETEVLAGEAIARVPAGGVVVEPCTGTGAIACSVALESAATTVVATDVSPAAVALAADNARRLGAAITVVKGDLLAAVPVALRGRVDVVVCNPPYLATADLAGREPEVVDWDPHDALVSGPTGSETTDRLAATAPGWLRAGGWLLMEIDSTRAQSTASAVEGAGFTDVEIGTDLTGAARFVVGRRGR